MITLPKGLTEIGDEAFSGCSAFAGQTVVAPAGVEKVGKMAFLGTGISKLITEDPEMTEKFEGGTEISAS